MNKAKGPVTFSGIVRRIPLIVCLVVAGLVALQLVFAVRYFGDCFPNMSKYADSKVYIAYADGRKVSAVRAVMYPLILRQLARISRPDLLTLIYSVQLAATFVASLYFCFALLTSKPDRHVDWRQARSWLVFLLPVAMLVDPLNLHLNLAVMPDSLTASLALVFVGSLVFIWSRPSSRYSVVHIAICLASFVILSLMRLEKPIVGSLVLVIMFIFSLVMLIKRRDKGMQVRFMILLVCILLIGNAISRHIDQGVPRRKTKDLSMSDTRLVVANRLALEVFNKIYDHLSEETRRHITPEVADKIRAKRKEFNFFMIPLLKRAPEDGRKILDDMIRTTLTREAWPVAKYVMEDLCLYLGTPIAYHYHLALRPNRNHYTAWTFRNMKRQAGIDDQPRTYIGLSLKISRVLLICLLAGVFAVCIGRRRGLRGIPPSASALLIVLLFHCMNTLFFAALTSRFHIRYALPSYHLLMLTCYVLLVAYVLQPSQRSVDSH